MKPVLLHLFVAITSTILISCGNLNDDQNEIAHLEEPISDLVRIESAPIEDNKTVVFSDFIYDIGPRFNVISKQDLGSATSFADFIGKEHADRIVSYQNLKVIVLDGDTQKDVLESKESGYFTKEQLDLLASLDYSSNILIWADYQETNFDTGKLEYSTWTPYLTIIPEKQASYNHGTPALKKYFKDNTEEVRADVAPEKLRPAKLFFTVSKSGSVISAYLDRPSGYPEVDAKMLELIQTTSGAWQAAENNLGEKVEQELVVSFGLIGC